MGLRKCKINIDYLVFHKSVLDTENLLEKVEV
jgi:hypothetical protein